MPDFLDQLGTELARAASSPTTQPTPDRRPTRWRMPMQRRGLLAAALGVVAAGGGVAIATLGRPTPGAVPPGAGAAIATNADPADLAAFGILRRPQTSADRIPREKPIALSGASGANLELARHVSGTDGGEAWVIPGQGSLCLLTAWPSDHAGGATCSENRTAIAGRLVLTAGAEAAPGYTFVGGVVPDGTTGVTLHLDDGTGLPLAVNENVYLARVKGSVSSVSVNTPSGTILIEGLQLPNEVTQAGRRAPTPRN